MVLFGPLAGALADRYDRRRPMIASDVIRAAIMMLLAAVAMADLPVFLASVLAAASTVASVVYPPCVAATTSRILTAADLPAATATRSAIGAASVVAGALLLLLHSPAWAFVIKASTFAVSALFWSASAPSSRRRRGTCGPPRTWVRDTNFARDSRHCGATRLQSASSAPTSCAALRTELTPSCC
ncbi:MFS transporter [Rugosimonospora africana]|uniref:MFS transporter n=1 Tax=Rugosimonospora africana TaxID=556532 RepID=UPI0019442DC1